MLLCGCGRFDITCSLGSGNTAEMKIDIQIPKEGLSEDEALSLEYSLNELMYYWEDAGYSVDWNYAGKTYGISIKKTAKAKDRANALDELLSMMGDDVSPFIYAEGGYSESYFNDIYNIKAEVDLSKIVDYAYIDTLPPSQKTKILDSINKFSGTVTFDLPGEIINHEGSVNSGKNTLSLNLDERAEISSVMEIQNTKNRESYDALTEDIEQLGQQKQQYMLAVFIAGGALVVIIVVSVICLLRRKNK